MVVAFQIRIAIDTGCAAVDKSPFRPVFSQVTAAVGGLVEFVNFHEIYCVIVETFSIAGDRSVRTVCVFFAVVFKRHTIEVIIFDAVLIFVQLRSEGDESGVDCLEVLCVFKTVVLAVAVSVLAVA